MRSSHLIKMVAPILNDKISFSLSIIPANIQKRADRAKWALSQPRNTVFFFTKHSTRHITPLTSFILKKKGGIICADYVDLDLSQSIKPNADVHIASSLSQAKRIKEILEYSKSIKKREWGGKSSQSQVFTLLHAADIRLIEFKPTIPVDKLRMAYFGAPDNCLLDNEMKAKVKIIMAGNQAEFLAALPQFSNYNAHYCIRPSSADSDIIKPLTKGIMAATCGAVPLLARNTPDAEELLGTDYPYYTEDQRSDSIKDVYAQMEDDFGGKTWECAKTAIAELANIISPEANAKRIEDLVKMVLQ